METGEERRRRRRNMQQTADAAPKPDPFAPAALTAPEPPKTPRQVLGLRPDATPLQVLQGYQRALSLVKTNDQRRELAAAFRKLGAQPIRTRCPEGHTIVLYAIDGEAHTAHCQKCHELGNEYSTYDYIGWAKCLKVSTENAADVGSEQLPLGSEPLPQRNVQVSYHAGSGNRTIAFTMDGTLSLLFGAGDSFSLVMKGRQPWWLLNHTSAVMIPLDNLRSYRREIDEAEAAHKARMAHQRLGPGRRPVR